MNAEDSAVAGLEVVAARQGGFVTLDQARASGLSESQIRTAVRRGEWQRVPRGLCRPEQPDRETLRQRTRRALMQVGAGSVAAGHTAAELLGIVGAPGGGPIWIAAPRDRHPERRRGVRVLRTIVTPDEVTFVDGIPVTCALRSVLDAARYGDQVAAVCLIESSLRQRIFSEKQFRAAISRIHGQCGSRRAKTALERIDLRSESPLETKARLLLLDEGFPYPEPQCPVADGDARRIDLAYLAPEGSPYKGLAIEVDGREHHAREAAFHADPRRQTALEEANWLVRRFTDHHLNDRQYVVRTVRQALERIGAPTD